MALAKFNINTYQFQGSDCQEHILIRGIVETLNSSIYLLEYYEEFEDEGDRSCFRGDLNATLQEMQSFELAYPVIFDKSLQNKFDDAERELYGFIRSISWDRKRSESLREKLEALLAVFKGK